MKSRWIPAVAAVALFAVGCGSDDQPTATTSSASAATTTTSSTVTTTPAVATPPASNSAMRAQACYDMLPLMLDLRAISVDAAQQAADETIANLPDAPEWPTTSEADRQATIDGIRDAANGSCTGPPTSTRPSSSIPAAVTPRAGGSCDPSTEDWAKDPSGQQLYCTYSGGPTPKWVESLPYIGTQPIGGPCELGEYVAESPTGEPMVCVGERGAGTWLPGP